MASSRSTTHYNLGQNAGVVGFHLPNPYAPVAAVPTTGVAGTLTGATPTGYSSALGGTPGTTDPLSLIAKAIAEYNKQQPDLMALANQQTEANQKAALKQITDVDPNFLSNIAQLSYDLSEWAQGKPSQSTKNQLIQTMAERGIGGGFGPNSPNIDAGLLSLLGQTSEGLQAKALTGLGQLTSVIPQVTPTSVSEFGLTPGNMFQGLYDAQRFADLVAAAPNTTDAYNLAKANAFEGLNLGGAAGTGPFAGYSGAQGTTSGTNQAILDMLSKIINRTTTTAPTTSTTTTGPAGWDPTVSAYYAPSGTGQVLPAYNPEEEFWNAVLYGE